MTSNKCAISAALKLKIRAFAVALSCIPRGAGGDVSKS
jgi:hypothetical protein